MSTSKVEQAGGAGYVWVDDRVPAAKYLKKQLGKVFPDHWSFMLGLLEGRIDQPHRP